MQLALHATLFTLLAIRWNVTFYTIAMFNIEISLLSLKTGKVYI